jgi:ComF family protein
MATAPGSPNTLICGECIRSTPSFDHCHSIIDYHYPLNQLILAVKSKGHALHTRALSRLLAQALREAYDDPISQLKSTKTQFTTYPTLPTLLLPVPQSRQRFQQRQFNPTRTIAKQLSHELKIAADYQLLRQIKDSNKQKDLNARQRQINLRGVFAIIEHYKHKLKPHQHVAIVDDVITTGATGKVIASLLKQHGVDRVSLWALARTPKPDFFDAS